jgi:hypothetical protein
MTTGRDVRVWLRVCCLAAALSGCSTIEPAGPGRVTGRIGSERRPPPDEFTFSGRTYVDRSLRIDGAGGVADAAIYLEGRPTTPWVSGKVRMNFGVNQFEPRVAFVSPGEPLEIGDTRDEAEHELEVNLKGLRFRKNPIRLGGTRQTRSGRPDRVSFECAEGLWSLSGNSAIAKGRTKELTFSRPVLAPLDWD